MTQSKSKSLPRNQKMPHSDSPAPDLSALFETPPEARPLARRDRRVIAGLGVLAITVLTAISGTSWTLGAVMAGAFLLALTIYTNVSLRGADTADAQAASYDASIYRLTVDLVDSLPEAVAIVDQTNRVLHANAAAKTLVNITRTGRPLSAYIPDKKIDKRLSRALAGYTAEPLMVHIAEPNEQHLRLLFSKARSFGRAGGQSLTLVIFNDVTDIVLEQHRRADFLANASHELKTPIASLMGYIETLRGHAKDDPEAQARFLEIMHSQAERMQRLISDLLSLRRIELSEHIPPTEIADLHLAVKAAMEVVAPLCAKRDVKIQYKSVKKHNALVRGKQDECVQLVLNLIENAAKISTPGSTVTLKLSRMEQWSPMRAYEDGRLPDSAPNRRIINAPASALPAWLMTISDEGPGFAREHLPRIGERFYRIAGDLSSREKGTGLGLAIVKHITRRHRGGLYIRTAEGVGTDFSVLLMADDEAGKAQGPELG